MSDPLQQKAEAMADAADLAASAAAGQPPVHRRTRAKKPAPPAPKRRAAGLLSHESHTRDIPAVAAELGLPVHTVRSIVMRAIQDWQAEHPVRELVRLHFESRLKKPTTAE
jgi:hypothetical protein